SDEDLSAAVPPDRARCDPGRACARDARSAGHPALRARRLRDRLVARLADEVPLGDGGHGMTWTLVLAAATVGALHTLAPDHWMPFAALARARGWTPVRALRTTIVCGLGHVTVSALLGIAALSVGVRLAELIGGKLASLAPALLMLFGTIYM